MNINNLIDKLNNELDRLNKLKESTSNINSFFTDNVNYNDDLFIKDFESTNEENNISEIEKNIEDLEKYSDIEPNTKETSLVVVKETPLITVQNMFKKSIRVSLKSFLISLSLSFLNLFI